MSHKNNVNPEHYTIAGRDRPGEDVVHDQERQSLAEAQARQDRRQSPLRPRSPGKRATRSGGEGETS